MAKTILIIEDDPDIVEMIRYNLTEFGYNVISADSGPEGLSLAEEKTPDLIILDIMLPGLDGFQVCTKLKNQSGTAEIPIIILSARSQENDKVLGLELGADDYITKPFSPRELIARIKANLRKKTNTPTTDSDTINRKDIVINIHKHKVTVRNKTINLTHTEFKLLELLARRPGIVFSRNQILDLVFGSDAAVYDRTVDAHIKSLRKKLDSARDYIETVRRAGYRFREI